MKQGEDGSWCSLYYGAFRSYGPNSFSVLMPNIRDGDYTSQFSKIAIFAFWNIYETFTRYLAVQVPAVISDVTHQNITSRNPPPHPPSSLTHGSGQPLSLL